MVVSGKKDDLETSEAAGRRSTRISIAIPITISGKDAAGNAFKEKSRTIIINKQGAKISTFHHLTLGTEIKVENQLLGRSAQATVVWIGDRRSPRSPLEVGIQLGGAENIWGIELPPEDWQEGPRIGPGGQRLKEAFARQGRTGPPTATGGPPPASPQKAAAAPKAWPPKSAKQAEAVFEERIRILEERLAKLSEQVASGESAAQREEETRKRVQEQAAALDRAFKEHVEEVRGRVRAEIESAGVEARRQQLASLSDSLAEELQSKSAPLVNRLQKQLETAIRTSQDKATLEAQQKIAKLAKDFLDGAVRDLRKTAEETCRAVERELKVSRQAVLDESKKRLETISKGAMDSFTKEAGVFEKEYPVQLLRTLKEYQDQMVHEIEAHLHKALENQRQAVLKQVQKVGEESAARAVAEVKAACDQVIKTRAEASSKALTDAWQDRVGEQSRATLETLREEAKGLLGNFRGQVKEAAGGAQEQSVKAATAKLQEVTDKLLDESAALLRKQADENMDLIADQLNEARARVVTQAEETLRRTAAKPSSPAPRRTAGKSGQS
jgi:hypothetical protein